jgi:hypothetical protein
MTLKMHKSINLQKILVAIGGSDYKYDSDFLCQYGLMDYSLLLIVEKA